MAKEPNSIAQPFPDVLAGSDLAQDIAELRADAVLHGDPDGTFRRMSPVTRAEMASIMVNLMGLSSEAAADGSQAPAFAAAKDITQWAWGAIDAAVAHGILKGYPDGTFGAERDVTEAEALTMVARPGRRLVRPGPPVAAPGRHHRQPDLAF